MDATPSHPNQSELLYLLALTKVQGIGPVTARTLIAWCNSAEAVFKATRTQLSKIPNIGESTIKSLVQSDALVQAELELKNCLNNGIEPIPYYSSIYPATLKVIYNAPLVLYQKGTLNLNDVIGIGVVGTRKPTEYGKMWARRFTEAFALRGFNVVSGLAYGIDSEAHRACLHVGGFTTAVLAHGLDRIYPPQHFELARRILDKGGALLTEYPWGIKLDPNFFPQRNRIIAGLCRAVVVIEAALKGGALITARYAFDQNREVYAVPGALGTRTSEGCNELIRTQVAQLVSDPQQVIDQIDVQLNQLKPNLFTPAAGMLTPEEQQILNCLEQRQQTIDELAEHLGQAPGHLYTLLLELEFKGLVEQRPGRKFKRC